MAQLNDVQPLEDSLAVLLQQLAPPVRRTLMRELAKTLRQRQKKQIQAQKNPDGSPYIPRKRRVLDKHGPTAAHDVYPAAYRLFYENRLDHGERVGQLYACR